MQATGLLRARNEPQRKDHQHTFELGRCDALGDDVNRSLVIQTLLFKDISNCMDVSLLSCAISRSLGEVCRSTNALCIVQMGRAFTLPRVWRSPTELFNNPEALTGSRSVFGQLGYVLAFTVERAFSQQPRYRAVWCNILVYVQRFQDLFHHCFSSAVSFLIFASFLCGLSPKIVVPTLTSSLPWRIAAS